MKIIVAVDQNWSIGNKGELQVRNKEDLQRFKDITTDNIIVLGAKTLETFPGGKPLKDRINIILNDKVETEEKDGNFIVNTLEKTFEIIKKLEKKYPKKTTYISGGASIYKQFLEYCDEAIITKWDFEKEADTYFPNLDELDNWQIYSQQNVKSDEGNFVVSTYQNSKVKKI